MVHAYQILKLQRRSEIGGSVPDNVNLFLLASVVHLVLLTLSVTVLTMVFNKPFKTSMELSANPAVKYTSLQVVE